MQWIRRRPWSEIAVSCGWPSATGNTKVSDSLEITMNQVRLRRLKVLVMHADHLLRAGLVASLRQHSGFEVFVDGEAASSNQPGFDVVIADYHDAMRLRRLATPGAHGPVADARILALTANDREGDVRKAVEAGVHGYLLLGASLQEIVAGAVAVGNGARYLCSSVARLMADSLTRSPLTAREVEVLQLVASGESNKGIARKLEIELGTVKSHVSALMGKLGAISRTHAASIAVGRGLVEEARPMATTLAPWFGRPLEPIAHFA
ncbi:MAG: response regulator transcription factor [Caldimonas sp.]